MRNSIYLYSYAARGLAGERLANTSSKKAANKCARKGKRVSRRERESADARTKAAAQISDCYRVGAGGTWGRAREYTSGKYEQ